MTTLTLAEFRPSPEIILTQDEHRTLLMLAMAGSGHSADDSDELLYELERAKVVSDRALPPDVVRMNSIVTYMTDNGTRTVQLVYPKQADIARGKISVLTPIGTALIGLRTGQSISWRTRDDRRQTLTVTRVIQPAGGKPEPEPEPPAAA
jgi:regulator of nucleoside diphosphate kinase